MVLGEEDKWQVFCVTGNEESRQKPIPTMVALLINVRNSLFRLFLYFCSFLEEGAVVYEDEGKRG